jgi:hypothetical protein
MKNINKAQEDKEFEEFELILSLERKWRDSLPRFTDREVLIIFPEGRKLISEKINEWQDERDCISRKIRDLLKLINHSDLDPICVQMMKEHIEITDGVELLKIDNHIRRLKRLLLVIKNKSNKGRINNEKIQQALNIPIQDILDQKFSKSGSKLRGLCPLHDEKTPSFFIYLKNNSFYCYGCQAGGDIINLIRKLHNYSFVEAVRYLIHV